MGWGQVQKHPRFKIQLTVRGILRSIEVSNKERVDVPAILTQTHDISAEGLSLFVPSLPFVFAYLLSPDNNVKLALELPSGTVLMLATLIHDRPISEEMDFPGYVITGLAELGAMSETLSLKTQDAIESAWLIGVQIKEMSEVGRNKYLAFLDTLK